MLKKLPTSVEWADDDTTAFVTKEIMENNAKNFQYEDDITFYVECDISFPDVSVSKFRNYPPLPVRKRINYSDLSIHSQALLDKYGMKCPSTTRLVNDVGDKKNVRIHIMYIKSLLSVGLEVTCVHRVVKMVNSAWMRDFVLYNTKMRDESTNAFSKAFFKLKINSQVLIFPKYFKRIQ